MATSSITVRMSSNEYSRYYRPLSVVTAKVTTVGAADGVTVTATLVRADGYGTVSTQTSTIASNAVTVSFDLNKDCFDSNSIYRAIQGVYTVHVTVSDSGTTADSKQFDIMLVSIKELKARYLRGVDLMASNKTTARSQPKLVTGVTIADTSTGQMRGLSTLAWDATAKTLTWDGGTAVTIDTTVNAEYLLVNASKTAYVEAEVAAELLPATNQSETIVMDYDTIEEEELRQFLLTATGIIEGKLYVSLEPRDFDTEGPTSPKYQSTVYTDRYVEPLAFYKPQWDKNWLVVKLPYPYLINVSRIEGWFNSSQAFGVDTASWIVKNDIAGEIEFVPKQGAILSFQFYGVPFFAYMYQFNHIPSFWHFRITAGLKDLASDNVRTRVRECIARQAAIDVLTLAGLASAPGLTAQSVSRDGVSQSQTFAQGPGGRYANVILQHSTWLYGADGVSGEIISLRKRLLGMMMTTL